VDYFVSLVRHFKKDFSEYRFSVRRVGMNPDFGDCWKRPDGSFLIRIRKNISEDAQLILLPHEVGHMLSYDTDKHPSQHGPHFGIGYSEAWQSYLRWVNG
jgi:hypothetical protein